MKRNKVSLLLAVVFVFLLTGTNAFALPDDSVLSQNIKESDGTSGQDTNSGSGVKTGHIQDGAVTTSKIIDGAVTTPKINDGAVTDTKIGSNAVTTPKIADGAVTDAKISGPISGTKLGSHNHDGADIVSGTVNTSRLNVGTTTGTVAAGDHDHDAVYQKKYAKVAVVAQSGGDYTNPVTAMNNISTWCGTPSATNPCLLKIMPGVYNIGSGSVQMREYVDIEGSGESTTKITGTANSYSVVSEAYVSNTEIRLLTVENTTSGSMAIGFFIRYGSSPIIRNVTAIASGSTNNYAIYMESSSPTIKSVTVSASGGNTSYGIYCNPGATPDMSDVTALASDAAYNFGIYIGTSTPKSMNNITAIASGGAGGNYGVTNYGGTLSIRNALVKASGPSMYNHGISNGGGGTVKVDHSVIVGAPAISNESNFFLGNTKLEGGIEYRGGTVVCAGVYDQNYTFYSNTCP